LKDFSKSNDDGNPFSGQNFVNYLLGLNPETIENLDKLDRKIQSLRGVSSPDEPSPEQPSIQQKKTKQKSILLSVLIKKYIDNKIKENRWKPHTVSEHTASINLFLKVVGDKPINSINRDICREYRDTLTLLPANHTKIEEYKDKSIKEIVKIQHDNPLSLGRINFLVTEISSLFEWAFNENLISFNTARNLSMKDKRKEIDERLPFDTKDLELIFSHPKFSQGKFKYPAYFWIPLIGLFTGMRL
jgi:site-specific recombinase XerD